ncbi:MAG: epoxyqueuosine reductase [Clostridia bacterium]|nr:epoxyqueuosine reductase [Clostridia bacterium]
MNSDIKLFFDENKIEYFAALDYRDCKESAPHIMEREGFIPKSVILFLIPYYAGAPKNISAYAASYDYHIFIKKTTEALISRLKNIYPNASFAAYGDHSPISECHAAVIAGLGVFGDNGLLINEKYGSFVFVADVVSDIEPELLGTVKFEVKTCSHCGRCRAACPTKILSGEGADCLSAITQRKGELADEEVELMKKCDTVWGCDLCQSACPHNFSPKLTPIPFFYEDRIDLLTSEVLKALSREEFKKRAFGWRGRAVVKRNLEKLGY